MIGGYRAVSILIFFLVFSLSGCETLNNTDPHASMKKSTLQWINNPARVTHAENNVAQFQFIGAGGFYLDFPSGGVLVDPFYSNPGLLAITNIRSLVSDPEIIDRHLPPLDNIKALLVGHAHFDHALDIPYIATKLPQITQIYGNSTLKNILATTLTPNKIVNVEPSMAVNGHGGRWQEISPHLRVLPISSNHAPQFGPWLFAVGNIEKPQRHLPKSALGWRSGKNLSYLLDLLDDSGKCVYRVFIQTSASSSPNGLVPDTVLAEKPVDMAVLSAAGYHKMEGYPEYLLARMLPQKVVIVHWEKFWTPYEPGQASPLPGLDLDQLYSRINAVLPQSEVSVLQRGAVMKWKL